MPSSCSMLRRSNLSIWAGVLRPWRTIRGERAARKPAANAGARRYSLSAVCEYAVLLDQRKELAQRLWQGGGRGTRARGRIGARARVGARARKCGFARGRTWACLASSDTSDASGSSILSLRAGGHAESDYQRLADGAGGERHAGGEERRFVAHERRRVATDIGSAEPLALLERGRIAPRGGRSRRCQQMPMLSQLTVDGERLRKRVDGATTGGREGAG